MRALSLRKEGDGTSGSHLSVSLRGHFPFGVHAKERINLGEAQRHLLAVTTSSRLLQKVPGAIQYYQPRPQENETTPHASMTRRLGPMLRYKVASYIYTCMQCVEDNRCLLSPTASSKSNRIVYLGSPFSSIKDIKLLFFERYCDDVSGHWITFLLIYLWYRSNVVLDSLNYPKYACRDFETVFNL